VLDEKRVDDLDIDPRDKAPHANVVFQPSLLRSTVQTKTGRGSTLCPS
jgi:hypothetical protein